MWIEIPSTTLHSLPLRILVSVTQEEKENGKGSKGFDNEISTFSKQLIANYFFIDIKIILAFV